MKKYDIFILLIARSTAINSRYFEEVSGSKYKIFEN